jgi:hypothetical protein
VQLLPSLFVPPGNSGYEYVAKHSTNDRPANQILGEIFVTQGRQAAADGLNTELEGDPPSDLALGLLRHGTFPTETAI